jgi:hypothetical protein
MSIKKKPKRGKKCKAFADTCMYQLELLSLPIICRLSAYSELREGVATMTEENARLTGLLEKRWDLLPSCRDYSVQGP